MGGLAVLLTRGLLPESGHRVATLLDSTRESLIALRYNFWRLQGTQSCRGKPSAKFAYWLFRLFSRHISRTQSFQQNRHILFHALVALKLLVSLIRRLVACSARIVVDRQTNRQTNRQTDTQTNYCNPRCACAPRVNKCIKVQQHACSKHCSGTECIYSHRCVMCKCITVQFQQIRVIILMCIYTHSPYVQLWVINFMCRSHKCFHPLLQTHALGEAGSHSHSCFHLLIWILPILDRHLLSA